VIWRNNKKAWMAATTMEERFNTFNAKMKKESKNAILFFWRCYLPPKGNTFKCECAWFPANAVSVLQPMNMGVIYTFKSHYGRFLMQSLISNVEEADSSCTLARSVLVLDAVNWIGLTVKKIKAETVRKCFAKAGFGESDVADNLEEASKNIAAISNLCQGKELSCDTKDFVQSYDHLAIHYSFEPATALLAVRNTQNKDVEEEEAKKQPENRIFQRKFIHMNRPCIASVK
jgi:hypothetical protein